MMTKVTLFQFLVKHQVPLRIAQRAVDIIDGKARAQVPLTANETALIEVGEGHHGRYYIATVTHRTQSGDEKERAGEMPGSGEDRRGNGLSTDEAPGVLHHRGDPSSSHQVQPNATDLQFIQARARRVVDEEEAAGGGHSGGY